MTIVASRYYVPYATAFDTYGVVSPGALLYFYLTGTSTPANTYADAGLATPNSNPVVADGAGLFPSIFLTPGQQYKVVLETATGDQIWTADPVETAGFPPEPSVTVLTTGTDTYTTPAGATRLYIRMVGPGASGAGSGTSASGGAGNLGTDTVFGTVHAATGSPGVANNDGGAGGTGGSGTATFRGVGGPGTFGAESTSSIDAFGGTGGSSALGGGAISDSSALSNTGGGGGGASINAIGSGLSGGGGGSGEYVELQINTPATTYTYTVGTGGVAGIAGVSGNAGGAGGSGVIIVTAYYS